MLDRDQNEEITEKLFSKQFYSNIRSQKSPKKLSLTNNFKSALSLNNSLSRKKVRDQIPQNIYSNDSGFLNPPTLDLPNSSLSQENAYLRRLFDLLDGRRLGRIGTTNLSLKNIKSTDLKGLGDLMIHIYKNPNEMYDFSIFTQLHNFYFNK